MAGTDATASPCPQNSHAIAVHTLNLLRTSDESHAGVSKSSSEPFIFCSVVPMTLLATSYRHRIARFADYRGTCWL
jgi:hypothetical protein